ncbi:response regulator [Bacillus aquiflavi]|uniref:Response regulator n=1 Tax=Bacillus aquiflavi TaxID=2672567 RepID=A0A6B3VYY2_9BACI|nr:response regulator [Bacillus aquiflavi]MBA4538138.1 response regulator [Bacillus aquiflavi]NEY82458.1 response regulator [Bacillus aquiflavi]UAC48570.1 response regulator [Bacillus aquiflavi]
MRVVLIDDEKWALNVLEQKLRKIAEVEVVKTYTCPQKAFQELKTLEIDVVFLDIEMGEVHGLEFAEILKTSYSYLEVVFVTAYAQFALEAFEVNAVDYLLKPINLDRLKKTIAKLQAYKRNTVKKECPQEDIYAHMMGKFQLYDQNKKIVKWRTKKVKELFLYLWHNQDISVHKLKILDDLWPDMSVKNSSTLLHTTVYQVRKTLKNIGIDNAVSFINDHYALKIEFESDILELEHIVQLSQKSTFFVEKALSLYSGDYLEEEHYDWAFDKQERIKQIFLTYLEDYVTQMIDHQKHSHLIISCLEKMIQLEPYNEKYMYFILDHYGQTRNIQKMMSSFQQFKKKWLEDLELDIPTEINKVYRKYIV